MADQEEDYFNDLSRQPLSQDATLAQSGNTGGNTSPNEDDGNPIPRQKRMACVVCRKRKLRCDGKKPSCGTCARVGHNCAYDEVRKKSGPKRGYVKQLEARLAQVEILLKNHEPDNTFTEPGHSSQLTHLPSSDSFPRPPLTSRIPPQAIPRPADGLSQPRSSPNSASLPSTTVENESSWEMISLGLEEALPTQEAMDELFDIYFQKVHPSNPMIHRARFLAAMDLAPHMRPPVCLRYIMWTLAASLTPKYAALEEHFYARARKYIHLDEMKGHGEHMVSVTHCQAWVLIALYEFKQMYFPRAWISVGRGARMAAMMCFNRLDGAGLDVKHCVPPPRDWIEREERRRTFWMSFAQDRYASIGTGWPMVFDERDIMTNLASSEEAFETGKTEEPAPTLKDVWAGDISNLSPLGLVAVMACIFGLNLTHLHRPDPEDREGDINGEFWKRHRTYDNILLNVALQLPQSLRLPQGISNPNIIFSNMAIHTSTICLHQAAIFKAEKSKNLSQIAAESKRRCIIAADQVTSIMKMVSHTDLSVLNPFSAFCLYVAARVFVQYLKSRPEDETVKSSLQFLLTALSALKRFSALTESFMVQLDVDLSGTSFASTLANMRTKQVNDSNDGLDCTPLVHIRQSQPRDESSIGRSPASRGASVPLQNLRLPQNRNRQKTTRPHTDNPNSQDQYHHQQNFRNSQNATRNNSPRQEDTSIFTTNFNDMDISPGVSHSHSDNMNSTSSDNPSPETLNSSSNNDFTPPNIDQLSMSGGNPSSIKNDIHNNLNLNHFNNASNINSLSNATSQEDISFTPFFDMAGMNGPIDPSAMQTAMSMDINENWSATATAVAMAQSSGLDNSSFDVMDDSNNFSDPQFDSLLRGMGWNGWIEPEQANRQ